MLSKHWSAADTATLAQPMVGVWGRDYLSVQPMEDIWETCLITVISAIPFSINDSLPVNITKLQWK